MGVHVAGFSVVVRSSAIEQRFPGGLSGFREASPNGSLCSDGHVTRVGFMTYDDADFFRLRLMATTGLLSGKAATGDIALVTQGARTRDPSHWLTVKQIDGRTVAWLTGTDCGEVALPWKDARDFEGEPTHFEDIKCADVVSAAMPERTGPPTAGRVYVGRPFASLPASPRWWEIWKRDERVLNEPTYLQAFEKARNVLDSQPWPDRSDHPTRAVRRRMARARKLLEQVVAFRPSDWAAQFLLGRACDLCGDDAAAYARYRLAWEKSADAGHVGPSFAICCMRLGRAEEALTALDAVLEKSPDEAGLLSDRAMALLLAGRIEESLAAVQRALAAEPTDEITRNVLGLIESVRHGRRRRPDRWPMPDA